MLVGEAEEVNTRSFHSDYDITSIIKWALFTSCLFQFFIFIANFGEFQWKCVGIWNAAREQPTFNRYPVSVKPQMKSAKKQGDNIQGAKTFWSESLTVFIWNGVTSSSFDWKITSRYRQVPLSEEVVQCSVHNASASWQIEPLLVK